VLVSRWDKENAEGKYLFSLLDEDRLKKILRKMLDENEFLSEYGIRSLSKYHKQHPFSFNANGDISTIQYVPGDSDSDVYGGNSNWRGPIWIPINFLIIESLRRYYAYYGNDFTIECPTDSGNLLNLDEVADELAKRLSYIFLKDENGYMAGKGPEQKFQADPFFKNYHLFHEYFDGDTGKGLGASHQTGWTSLITRYLFTNKNERSSIDITSRKEAEELLQENMDKFQPFIKKSEVNMGA
jgi:glycogen debranching enzyme